MFFERCSILDGYEASVLRWVELLTKVIIRGVGEPR